MNVEIRRTTVTPTETGNVVQLHISDRQPEDASAAFVLQLYVSLPQYDRASLLEEAQRKAMKEAQVVLTDLLQRSLNEIQKVGLDDLKEKNGS